MLFRNHILLGIVFFLLLKDYINGGLVFFILVLLGSILPDIDERNSKINQWSGFIGKIIATFSKHRGFFHSFLFIGILIFIVWNYFGLNYGLALGIGFLAHVVGDGITPMGVQMFYPFSKFKVRGPIRVGGWMEGIIFLFLVLLIVKELVSLPS
jgi:inner membrane protein